MTDKKEESIEITDPKTKRANSSLQIEESGYSDHESILSGRKF